MALNKGFCNYIKKVSVKLPGFGHGIGMSQNGANEMAKLGFDYKEIINKFYNETEIIE